MEIVGDLALHTFRMRLPIVVRVFTAVGLAVLAAPTWGQEYSVIAGHQVVGAMVAVTEGRETVVSYHYESNGRGPKLSERITVDANAVPIAWKIKGRTTFGSPVDENYRRSGDTLRWQDEGGGGEVRGDATKLYIPQNSSPWFYGLYARLLKSQQRNRIAALPSGTLTLSSIDMPVAARDAVGAEGIKLFAISGAGLSPAYVALDARQELFAYITPKFVVIRKGFESMETMLHSAVDAAASQRFVALQREYAHRFTVPVRIRNVRCFDPIKGVLTDEVAVVISGRRIAAIEPADSPPTPGETVIEGAGGTLIAGFTDVHAHLDRDSALLNLLAGITSVRDMGNDNAMLGDLIAQMDSNMIAGPRVVRAGFIEGKSPYSANNGIIVSSEKEAIDAVRWYAARNFWQIKIYSSVDPAWVPAIVAEAHRLGLHAGGHIPAFSDGDAMIGAGYDELTHINQLMLGWVYGKSADTRTILRLTGLRRLADFDFNAPAVQKTLSDMAARGVAIDPSLVVHETLLLARAGKVTSAATDYYEHMPPEEQRSLKQQFVDLSVPGDDAAYQGAYRKIFELLAMMRKKGILILPGTDTGGSFSYHRELELMQRIGMTPAEILRRSTLDTATYFGRDQELGSIEKGKLADFFLVPGNPLTDLKQIKRISMVVKDGIIYFPAEIYPVFGIRPFAAPPAVAD